ncbi:MAG: hypothetical protein A3B11_01885 [Candidatus Taylorbacteria bacterium RIFCSPLOWO2_01_FULL_44_26]|uniref:Uncharacterized protein n=1 Tax=Candidatus Taylorbacteria bacterium RIFCSPLOWO2_01_FULL_44_26 TaxID=1802318 RepID=A0A1G2N5M2_9BACT|nr:MAG: hypothetical protein A3B11_01885 [Candidatus Taylorbacteria bacterium RIFCSPLOWO2_01_FULL_44_26]
MLKNLNDETGSPKKYLHTLMETLPAALNHEIETLDINICIKMSLHESVQVFFWDLNYQF